MGLKLELPKNESDSVKGPVISTGTFSRPGRILVVDDDNDYRELLKRILARENHDVILARSGQEGLCKAAHERPELILLDFNLPDLNGLQVCQQLRETPELENVPVMMITDRAEDEIQSKALDSGVNDFLSKTTNPQILLARVRTMLKYQRVLQALRVAQQRLTRRVESQAVNLHEVNLELKNRVQELERLQENAKRTNEQLDQLISAIPSILIGLDRDNRIVHWNAAAGERLGLDSASVLGRPLLECEIEWDRSVVIEAIMGCREKNQPVRVEQASFRRPSGDAGLLGLNISPLPDEHGQAGGILIFGADVTDRVNLEQQYLHSQKMDAIGRLAGGVAHDFNNILMVIIGQCELMRFGKFSEEQRDGKLEEVLACSHKAAKLTNQLLAFGRKQLQQREVLDLNEVIDETSKMLRRIIGEHIEMVFNSDPKIGKVNVDPNQMTQVLMNLAVNARDAMPKGGRLEIRTSRTTRIKLPFAKPQEHVLLAVSDTGHGMDQKTLSRCFEPFFTTKEKGKGTGLGLATVYGIIEQSEGHIEAESLPGKGSTFKVYLPVVDRPDQSIAEEKEETALPTGTETILVVEDEGAIRELVCEMLEAQGYSVIGADNSADAIRICQSNEHRNIHLLLSDLVMPDMSGLELAERLETLRPGMKTLYMSGYSDTSILPHHQRKGKLEFIPKPFTREQLLPKVRRVLDL